MEGITKPLRVSVVGGDMRLDTLARLMLADGHRVTVLASGADELPQATESDLRAADLVVLPLPALNGGAINAPRSDLRITPDELFSRLMPGTLIVAGRVTDALRRAAEARGLTLVDCLEREELAVLNAIPTAEGAVELALGALGITLHRANALVIGFGRIGKLLSLKLRALGSEVTATARRYSDLAWIDALGCTPLRTDRLAEALPRCDVVFNTVPARVLGRSELALLRRGTPIIDLASLPGGADDEAARELGLEVTHALSLPGLTAPLTAGRMLRDTVYNILDSFAVTKGDNHENNA